MSTVRGQPGRLKQMTPEQRAKKILRNIRRNRAEKIRKKNIVMRIPGRRDEA